MDGRPEVAVVDRRWRLERDRDATRGGQTGRPDVADLGERLERDGQEQRETGERHQCAGGEGAVECQASTHPDREREEQRRDHRRERLPRAVEASERDGAGTNLRGAFGEPSAHAVLAAESLHHSKTGGDVGRDRRRVGEPLLLFGRPPVVRAPQRHEHEEARGKADEDEAPEDRRRGEHARADGEERDDRAGASTHEVGDAAHPLRVAGGERQQRAGLDVDATTRIEHAARDESLDQPPGARVQEQRAPVAHDSGDRLRHRDREQQRRTRA